MAINKKIINFTSKKVFEGPAGIGKYTTKDCTTLTSGWKNEPDSEGNLGLIPWRSIVTIEDSNEIWSHGKYIGGNISGLKITLGGSDIEVATKSLLTNGSVTKIGTSTVGSNYLPIYIKDGVPTQVSGMYESYLSWGGRNILTGFGPIDASLVNNLGANRFAFARKEGVFIEYSNDGGNTWNDYGVSDDTKLSIFAKNIDGPSIGKLTTNDAAKDLYENPSNNLLRIRVITSLAYIYTIINKIVIYVTTNGSSNSWFTLKVRLQKDYSSNTDTYKTIVEKLGIGGWSGYNIINIPSTCTYGDTSSTLYGEWIFLFGADGYNKDYYDKGCPYHGLAINGILCFGGMGLVTPSNLASIGHIYSYDGSQNTVFPAKVTASQIVKSGGTSKQFLKADGSVDTNTYLTASDITNKADKATTLAGYGIDDTYTKTEINNLLPNITNETQTTGTVSSASGVEFNLTWTEVPSAIYNSILNESGTYLVLITWGLAIYTGVFPYKELHLSTTYASDGSCPVITTDEEIPLTPCGYIPDTKGRLYLKLAAGSRKTTEVIAGTLVERATLPSLYIASSKSDLAIDGLTFNFRRLI